MSQLVTLVHMGDSITFGQHIAEGVRWTSVLARRLESRVQPTEADVLSLNRGISGETTRMGLERFPKDVQEAHPQILTLQFGMNDCNCWLSDRGLPRVSSKAFHANLIEMIERVRSFQCREIILSTNPVTLRSNKMLSGEPYEVANARYSELIRDVARATGVTLCDIRKVFEAFSPTELSDLLLPYPDQLHLGIKGNLVYADAIFPYIDRALESVVKSSCGPMNDAALKKAG